MTANLAGALDVPLNYLLAGHDPETRRAIARQYAASSHKALYGGDYEKALKLALCALDYDARCAAAVCVLAYVTWRTKLDPFKAESTARDCLRLCTSPEDVETAALAREILAYSIVQQAAVRYDPKKVAEAEGILAGLAESRPSDAVYRGLSLIRQHQHRMPEARDYAAKALALDPDNPWNVMATAVIEILQGELGPGWKHFHAFRMHCFGVQPPTIIQPAWDGSTNLAGKTLLIRYDYSGLGDYLMYTFRYAEAIERAGGRVVMEVHERLLPIMSGVKGVAAAFKIGDELPPYDFAAFAMALPWLCGNTSRSNIWWTGPYVIPDPAKVEAWRDRITSLARGRLRVGLSWAAGEPNNNRSIPLKLLSTSLGSIPGVAFFSLQRGAQAIEAELEKGRLDLINLEEPNGTLADTAAAMASLDLVVSVDTMTAHMAGAMGRLVWTLLPYISDARWGIERPDTPWYPSMTLFRASIQPSWAPAVQAVCGELAKLAAARG